MRVVFVLCFAVLGHDIDVKYSICTTCAHFYFASCDFRWYARHLFNILSCSWDRFLDHFLGLFLLFRFGII